MIVSRSAIVSNAVVVVDINFCDSNLRKRSSTSRILNGYLIRLADASYGTMTKRFRHIAVDLFVLLQP